MRDGETNFNAELVTVSGFAFADAFDFRRMQRVQLVLVLRLLCTDALRSLQQNVQRDQRGRRYGKVESAQTELAAYLSDQLADDGSLPFHSSMEAFKLLGVGIASGFPFKRFAFLGKRLAQRDPAAFGVHYDLVPGDL